MDELAKEIRTLREHVNDLRAWKTHHDEDHEVMQTCANVKKIVSDNATLMIQTEVNNRINAYSRTVKTPKIAKISLLRINNESRQL